MTLEFVVAAVISLILVRLLLNALTPGLYHFPGPWLAKFSDIWRFNEMYQERQYETIQRLHEKYGSAVRIGPNVVNVSDPALIEPVFGTKNDFSKSDMMKAWHPVINGQDVEGIADTQDNRLHAQLKRPVASIYSLSNLHTSEPFVDDTVKYFLKRLDEKFIRSGHTCDIDRWLQYFAFDVMGQLTFSRRLGFLEHGCDVEYTMAAVEVDLRYRALIGQMPWLHKLLKRNPIYTRFVNPSNPIAVRTIGLLKDREARPPHDPNRRDMYSQFLEARKRNPDTMSDNMLVRYTFTNILAGSDTTAIALRSILYYTLKNPPVLSRLRKELDSAKLTYPPDFKTAQALPYLDAVIREGIRYHPVAGFSLERIVPKAGLELSDGRKLPAGTTVAMNAWTINFTKSIFGEDSAKFNPDRWLKSEGENDVSFQRRLREMKNTDFSFSYGPRVCLGRHVAQMELWKLVPTLFGCLDMELANPDKEWKIDAAFVVKQSDMDIKIRWREGVDVQKMTAAE